MTDLEHYRRYLGGDESGLSELMHRYGDALTVYIDGYLGDIQESEDLMIEAFSYLCLKKPRIREGSLKPDERDTPERHLERAELRRAVARWLDRLSPEHRQALVLRELQGLSYAETAGVMGKSVKQITNLVYRGKQSLRGLLEKEGIANA